MITDLYRALWSSSLSLSLPISISFLIRHVPINISIPTNSLILCQKSKNFQWFSSNDCTFLFLCVSLFLFIWNKISKKQKKTKKNKKKNKQNKHSICCWIDYNLSTPPSLLPEQFPFAPKLLRDDQCKVQFRNRSFVYIQWMLLTLFFFHKYLHEFFLPPFLTQ